MTAANRITGKDLYVTFGGTVMTADFTEFSAKSSLDLVDVSAGSETEKSYLAALGDADFGLKLFWTGTAGSAVEAALSGVASGTLTWAPKGTTAGYPKYSCMAFVKSRDVTYPFDDSVQMDVAFQKTGDWLAHFGKTGSIY